LVYHLRPRFQAKEAASAFKVPPPAGSVVNTGGKVGIKPINSIHPEMTNFPDIGVARKILSSEYQPYACGKIFRAP
jgi:hypothetical protein